MQKEHPQQNLADILSADSQFRDRDFFKAIPKDERINYIKKALAKQQLPGPPPFKFKKDFPLEGKCKYQDFNMHYYSNECSPKPKVALFLFHGMGSHSGFSGYYANTIWENIEGLNLYALDQLNFGKSEGPFRGLIQSFEDSVKQAQTFVDYILGKLENKPKVFLVGTSYGGAISLQMSINSPEKYSGLILLAPALRVNKDAFGYLLPTVKLVNKLFPKVRLWKQKEFKTGTRYNNKEELLADQLNYNDGLIPHMRVAAIRAMQLMSTQYHLISSPYLLFQGGHDKFVDPFGPIDLEQASPSKDKTTLYCESMWHAIFGEQQIQEVAQISIRWLKKRI